MVPSSWYPVLGAKSLVPSTEYQVLGTRPMVPGTWRNKYLLVGPWHQVVGATFLVPNAWRPVLRTKNNDLIVTRDIINKIKNHELKWDDLVVSAKLDESIIEYIDPAEQNGTLIAMKPSLLGSRARTVSSTRWPNRIGSLAPAPTASAGSRRARCGGGLRGSISTHRQAHGCTGATVRSGLCAPPHRRKTARH